MHPIKDYVKSHVKTQIIPVISKGKVIFGSPATNVWRTKLEIVPVTRIRQSNGKPVKSFQDLVSCVAEIGFNNQRFNLLFRGQRKDYRDKKYQSVLYPTLCRPDARKRFIRTTVIKERYRKLNQLRDFLLQMHPEVMPLELSRHPESSFALLQHYGILPTPLIDLTQSLRVAATFALRNSRSGYVFVFGMPHPHGSISHYIDLDMVLVKLQNVCPPDALRPHYQEGFLAGRLPFLPKKEAGDNLARRMIGKYYLDNSKGNFWSKDFQPIPEKALFPTKDPFKRRLGKILKIS